MLIICGRFNQLRTISTSVARYAKGKKKQRIDPVLLRARLERKKAKFEEDIEALVKGPKQLIPMIEHSLTPTVQKEMELRTQREFDPEIEKLFFKMNTYWSLYNGIQAREDRQCLIKIQKAHTKALKLLQELSPELYLEAVKIDPLFVPYVNDQVIKETPANPEYRPPDGHRKDLTKVWKM